MRTMLAAGPAPHDVQPSFTFLVAETASERWSVCATTRMNCEPYS